jgi:hypothetical protein
MENKEMTIFVTRNTQPSLIAKIKKLLLNGKNAKTRVFSFCHAAHVARKA